MEAKDIPADMMAMIRKKFEDEPQVKGLRTQQYLLQQKKDYKAKDYKVIFHLMEDYEDGIRAINAQILCLKNDLSAYMNARVKSK